MKSQRYTYKGMVYHVYHAKDRQFSTPPLLMIHGHGGDHRGLEALANEIDTVVIIPDLPGFGESEELPEAHTIENYVMFLKTFMHQFDIADYYVLGHSLGSAIALALTVKDSRVKKLILLNPIPEFTTYIQYLVRTVNGIGSKMPPKMADAFVKAKLYNLATFLVHSRKRIDRAHAVNYLRTQNTTRYSFRTWSESGESIFYFDQMELAKKITVPSLVMHGDKDSLTSLASITRFAESFKANLVRIPKAGHFLPLEHIAEAAESVTAFIEGRDE